MQVLAVFIAFVSIILLLSILVTTLVQFTQAVLRLRGRNLVTGLAALLHATSPSEKRTRSVGRPERDEAREVLNTLEVGNLSPDTTPTQITITRLLGPRISWIDADRFLNAADAAGKTTVDKSRARSLFPVVEAAMEKRFILMMRICSLAWGLAIAVLFQISAPRLFHELWMDPERAAAISEKAGNYLKGADEIIDGFHDYEEAATDALVELASRYPDSRARIEAASGIGVNREFIIEELRTALGDDPDRDRILDDYADLLDKWQRDYVAGLSRTVGYASGELHALGFVPMPEKGFFVDHGPRWPNIFGVLITAILLMLGAPFWFNILRNLVSLRDALAGKSDPDAAKSS
jgi:hypothetical protein